jgi:hypothetical protein
MKNARRIYPEQRARIEDAVLLYRKLKNVKNFTH